jgi:hypothetical protein
VGKTLKQTEILIQKTTIPSIVTSSLLLGSAGFGHGIFQETFLKC